MNKVTLYIILFVVLFVILYTIYRRNFKRFVVGSVCLLTGKPKTGKTLACVYLAGKDFRRRHRVYWFRKHILLNKKIEEPLFYTNVAYSFGNLKRELFGKKKRPHRLNKCIKRIELDHLERNYRFNYGSVIFLDEASLLSDNQDVRNQMRNAELSIFNKLIAHETRGGVLYYDTQNIQDLHYACKRVCSNFYFIQKTLNFWLFRILYVREMISEDLGSNNFIDDIDTTTRKVLIFRWWYKKYDRYYFSYLTDKLSTSNKSPKWYKGNVDSFNPLYRKLSYKYRSKKRNKEIKQEILDNSTYRKRGFLEYEETK